MLKEIALIKVLWPENEKSFLRFTLERKVCFIVLIISIERFILFSYLFSIVYSLVSIANIDVYKVKSIYKNHKMFYMNYV